jgi:hypothetical protein
MNADPVVYRHTQFGWPSGLAFLGVVGVVVIAASATGGEDGLPPVFFAIVAVVLGALGIFSRMHTEVTDRQLRVAFRPGWPRRTIPLDRIRSARPVRSSWLWGWGVRLTHRGWLWNVSGLTGVELEFQGGGRFRIGTDDPGGLLEALAAEGVRRNPA